MATADRLAKIRAVLEQRGLDAILVSEAPNRRYLSGFAGSAGYLLITDTNAVLATDSRYVEQAGRQAPDFRVERIGGAVSWFPKLAAEVGARRVGFEAQDLTVSTHASFRKAVKEAANGSSVRLYKTVNVVERIRAVKDDDELALLQRSSDIANEALDEIGANIQPGTTEGEIAWELEKAMKARGAEEASFATIVGAGANGALPHHRADDTVVEEGKGIVIDMGALYEGYCSDLTRTVFVGEPDEKFEKVYGTVLKAQLEAEAQLKTGMMGEEVDKVARQVIEEAGHGDEFGHSLGHGVGLAVHESPHIGPRSKDVIEDGMVLTIEPGIYIPGWGGVRIEDMVVMENGRGRVMSSAKKLQIG